LAKSFITLFANSALRGCLMNAFGRSILLPLAAMAWSCSSSDEPEPEQQTQIPAAQSPASTVEPVTVTDSNGMTIYYYDRDEANKSSCNKRCAEFWLPVRPSPQFADLPGFGSIQRADGTQQLTFQGRPLYTFSRDKKPGDAKGDGQQGVWHVFTY
jgi:predicted lipoprotein with Yx(FWY)xxD motif